MAGSKSNPKSSKKYYAKSPSSRAKKKAYDTKANAKPAAKKKRSELAKERRKRGVMGKGGKDMSHTKSGKMVPESLSKNRARQGANGKSTKK